MEDNRITDPREVVEVYRHPAPREVVETYRCPLPQRMRPAQQRAKRQALKRRKRRRWYLAAFLLCLAVAAAAAALAWFRPWEEPTAPPAQTWEETGISIPTYPTGGEASFLVEEQGTERLTLQDIYRRVNPSVVTVMVQIGPAGDYTRMGVGTGVIFTADGYLITNYHVLEGGTDCLVALDTGATYPAQYVAGDEENDLAVLKIEETDLPAAVFADSNDLVVGDGVCAIGNPLGMELRGTLTDGIVSAINRDVWVDGRTMTLIQTNAALNSGNSGGPLINEYGQVVGINVIKMTSRYNNVEGLGFAIPSAYMQRIINDLLTWGELQPEPVLGITVMSPADQPAEGIAGLLVDSVTPGSAADLAGVQKGDYVLSADGRPLTTSQDLLSIRRQHYLGDELPMTLWREGEILEVTLRLEDAVEGAEEVPPWYVEP